MEEESTHNQQETIRLLQTEQKGNLDSRKYQNDEIFIQKHAFNLSSNLQNAQTVGLQLQPDINIENQVD